jgi:hypothetical protein
MMEMEGEARVIYIVLRTGFNVGWLGSLGSTHHPPTEPDFRSKLNP